MMRLSPYWGWSRTPEMVFHLLKRVVLARMDWLGMGNPKKNKIRRKRGGEGEEI